MNEYFNVSYPGHSVKVSYPTAIGVFHNLPSTADGAKEERALFGN